MSDETLRYEPDYASPPGNTLKHVLQSQGMTQSELAARAGWSEKFVSQVANGKAPLSPETALVLERVLGTPASFWMNREANYREALARIADRERLQNEADLARRFPYNEMAKRGWVEKTRDWAERALNLQRFFSVASLMQTDARPAAIFRVGKCSNPSDCAIITWLRAGELQARSTATAGLSRQGIRADLSTFRRLTVAEPRIAVEQLRALLAGNGVALALVPALPKTAAHGATHWLGPNKAILQLSDRYKRADIFWFSFFHEIGHLLLHGKRPGVYVNRIGRQRDDKEHEADDFAADALIPPEAFAEISSRARFSAGAVRDFADSIDVHPGIVVGRLQYEGLLPRTHLNGLREEFDLSQIEH